MQNLELALFASEDITLEEGALIASGVREEHALKSYLEKLSRLIGQVRFLEEEKDEYSRGRRLFDWLWQDKPARYKSRGPFRLTEVIEAQLSETKSEVGNCLGLTLLFNILAKKSDLGVEAAYLEDVSGANPHVISVIKFRGKSIDVDHMSAMGYDSLPQVWAVKRVGWGDRELIADIYHSEANLLFYQGKYEEALENYDKSLRLNPHYDKAYINAAMVLFLLGKQEEAHDYLERASASGTS
jgi:tetratricopeptide (TPR) repeat protein